MRRHGTRRGEIDASSFGAGLGAGAELPSFILRTADATARAGPVDADLRFIWEKDATRLRSGADGSGALAPIPLADLPALARRGAADIWLV